MKESDWLGHPLWLSGVKNLPAMWETWVGSLGWEDPLEMGTATHSSILAWSILAWRIPIQSMGSQRAGHDKVDLHFHC